MDIAAVLEAAREGHIEELRALLKTTEGKSQLDVPVAVNGGNTPLTASVWANQLDSIKVLVEAGVNMGVFTNGLGGVHQTALHYCSELGRTEAARYLLNHPSQEGLVNLTTEGGDTPLDIATEMEHKEMCALLQEYGGTVHKCNTTDNGDGGSAGNEEGYDELPAWLSFGK